MSKKLKFILIGLICCTAIASTTAYMGLEIPTVGSTPGPTWATMLNTAFTTIDAHDHTSGKGIRVPSSGININADLDFNTSYGAKNIKRLGMVNHATSISDINSYYAYSGQPLFNNSAGTSLAIISVSNQVTPTIGDMIYATSSSAWGRLAASTSGLFLKTNGAGTAPSWANPSVTTPISGKANAQTGYTLLATDSVIIWTLTNGSNNTYTVPLTTTVGAGQTFTIKLLAGTAGFNTLIGSASGADSFKMSDGSSSTTLRHQTGGETYKIISDGAGSWQVVEHLTNTSWETYTVTTTGVGTPGDQLFKWRRIGDSLEVQGFFITGTCTAADVSFTLPTSLAMDTTKLIKTGNDVTGAGGAIGSWWNNAANGTGAIVTATATSTVLVYGGDDSGSAVMLTPADGNASLANSVAYSVRFILPISGWSS